MIRLKVSGANFDAIFRLIDVLAHPDLRPLAERVKQIMLDDNRNGLLAGLDSFGDAMEPVKQSTIKRGRGGDGPPLAPRYGASRAIADYRVDIVEGDNRTLLIGTWPNSPFIHFHAGAGTKWMVARDPVDVRPAGQILIGEALADYAMGLVGGRAA